MSASASSLTNNCPHCGHDLPDTTNTTANTKSPSRLERIETPIQAWIIKHKVLVIAAFILILMPAPYNPQYWLKRAIFKPKAVCNDGVYSFSSGRSGICSGHGGVNYWMLPEK